MVILTLEHTKSLTKFWVSRARDFSRRFSATKKCVEESNLAQEKFLKVSFPVLVKIHDKKRGANLLNL